MTDAVTGASSVIPPNTATTTPPSSTSEITDEFNQFLQLLTAQVKNQDPLSPLDSTQFVEQLATFSSLEQQVQTNDILGDITTLISDQTAMMAGEWLGQSVAIESSWVPFDGNPVELQVDTNSDADERLLSIKDVNSNTVYTEALEATQTSFSWNGTLQDGTPVPAGQYQVAVDLYQNNEFIGSEAPKIVTTVTTIANDNGTLRVGTSSNLTADVGIVEKIDD